MRRVVALPLPTPGAAADKGTAIAALDFAPQHSEAETETVVGAGRFGHCIGILRHCLQQGRADDRGGEVRAVEAGFTVMVPTSEVESLLR